MNCSFKFQFWNFLLLSTKLRYLIFTVFFKVFSSRYRASYLKIRTYVLRWNWKTILCENFEWPSPLWNSTCGYPLALLPAQHVDLLRDPWVSLELAKGDFRHPTEMAIICQLAAIAPKPFPKWIKITSCCWASLICLALSNSQLYIPDEKRTHVLTSQRDLLREWHTKKPWRVNVDEKCVRSYSHL